MFVGALNSIQTHPDFTASNIDCLLPFYESIVELEIKNGNLQDCLDVVTELTAKMGKPSQLWPLLLKTMARVMAKYGVISFFESNDCLERRLSEEFVYEYAKWLIESVSSSCPLFWE